MLGSKLNFFVGLPEILARIPPIVIIFSMPSLTKNCCILFIGSKHSSVERCPFVGKYSLHRPLPDDNKFVDSTAALSQQFYQQSSPDMSTSNKNCDTPASQHNDYLMFGCAGESEFSVVQSSSSSSRCKSKRQSESRSRRKAYANEDAFHFGANSKEDDVREEGKK